MPQAPIYLTPTPHMDATRGGELADRILTLAEQDVYKRQVGGTPFRKAKLS